MESELQAACDTYLKSCFTESDRKQIEDLLAAKDHDQLRKRMLPRITFGTSGLRSKMEAGYARMNDLTVFQASMGLRDHVLASVPEASTRGIVIGHDHRHNSQRFAQIIEAVFAPVMKVYVFGTLVHTPLVPFTVKTLKAACGVMVTASHNPKADNGYKVYGENACAIISPHDRAISDAILEAARTHSGAQPQIGAAPDSVENVYASMTKAYFGGVFDLLGRLRADSDAQQTKGFKFCYTPMHGVGLIYARLAVSAASSSSGPQAEMIVVAEQALPDPDFPTVKFPNPEEAGALDLAMQTADNEGASLVVATDPDADRLGVAEKVDGKWRILTGNQIGVLLASLMIKSTDRSRRRAMLSSTVSSKMLEAVGKQEGIHWEETLTGFKWLSNRALQLSREEGYDVIFCYEEAIGFMPSDIVYDKDGISSLAVLLTLAQSLYGRNQSLTSELEALYRKYGFFASSNSYFIVSDATLLRSVMSALRPDPPTYLTSLGERRVTRVRDLTRGYDSATEGHAPTLPTSSSSEMITYWLERTVAGGGEERATLTVRGSGTEPKLKWYIEVQSRVDMRTAEASAKSIETDMIAIWLKNFDLERA